MDGKGQIPVEQEPIRNIQHGVGHLRDINGGRGHFRFSAFDAADVQHVVDQGQQMLGAFTDFFKTVLNLRLGLLLQGDIGKTDDGVHGRPDIVGHIIQEGGLGAACVLGFCQCVLQRLLPFLFCQNLSIVIAQARNKPILNRIHTDKLYMAVVNAVLSFDSEIQIVLGKPLHPGAEILCFHSRAQGFHILLQNEPAYQVLPSFRVGVIDPFVRGDHSAAALNGGGQILPGICQEYIDVLTAQRADNLELVIFQLILPVPAVQADDHQQNAAQQCCHHKAIEDAVTVHTMSTCIHDLVDVIFPHHNGEVQTHVGNGPVVHIGIPGIFRGIHRKTFPPVFPVLPDGVQTVALGKLCCFFPYVEQIPAVGILIGNVQQVLSAAAEQAADGLVIHAIELHGGNQMFHGKPQEA